MRRAEGRWQLGTQADAPLDATISLDGIDASGRAIEHAALRVSGSARAHRGELRVESAALPPEWADALATRSARARCAGADRGLHCRAGERADAGRVSGGNSRSAVVVVLEGGLVDGNGERNAGWQGSVRELLAQSLAAPHATWLRARDIRGGVFWAGGPARASLAAGSAEALGATLRWSRVAWQGVSGRAGPGRLDAQATIDPLPLAPILRTLQPDFGWGGDLAVGARIDVRSAPTTVVDVVVERAGGDLTVTDEISTQPLGFTDLQARHRRRKTASGASPRASPATTLGVVSGAVVARTGAERAVARGRRRRSKACSSCASPSSAPGAPGCRPAGGSTASCTRARASAAASARRPTPAGSTARTWRCATSCRAFTSATATSRSRCRARARGSSASAPRQAPARSTLEGDATFDAAPVAHLTLSADKLRAARPGRSTHRRQRPRGAAARRDDARARRRLQGRRRPDRLHAQRCADARRRRRGRAPAGRRRRLRPRAPAPAGLPAAGSRPTERKVALDLRVDMGEKLRVRGHGLDAGLRGELHLNVAERPARRRRHAAHGRRHLPGVRPEADDRSRHPHLHRAGREPAPRHRGDAARRRRARRRGGHGHGADTAHPPLLRAGHVGPRQAELARRRPRQRRCRRRRHRAPAARRARACSRAKGQGATDRLTHAIGLDSISVRQSEGEVKDTIVSLGKQISKRWYVGYERGLNATDRQLAADLPHRPAPHDPRPGGRRQRDRPQLDAALAIAPAAALRRDVPVGLLDVVLHEGVDRGSGTRGAPDRSRIGPRATRRRRRRWRGSGSCGRRPRSRRDSGSPGRRRRARAFLRPWPWLASCRQSDAPSMRAPTRSRRGLTLPALPRPVPRSP